MRIAPFATVLSIAMTCAALPAFANVDPAAAPTVSSGPLSSGDVKQIAWEYLKSNGQPGQRVGAVERRGHVFAVQIVSPEGIPVQTLKVDADTGKIAS